ncbi:putative zinc finger protein 85-like [Penaeus vannamei]|uniref:Putative zinc finger protein 85-like n=1 Tax=Penaeus vannamei TaxID=6689 RepID=A0A3R7SWI3_PENVA|nr:putative zinc finger protein 85-like [Penaeus vannamei]
MLCKDRPYKCDQCTASFIDPGELSEHKKKHSGDGPFTCEDCHFTFMYKSHFRSHKTRCQKKRAMMPHPPKPIANNRSNTKNNSHNNRQQNANNTVPFNPSNPTFKRQKKEQRQDRPFECHECDASFQTLQDLQSHKAKHTGEGPFKCEECRFVFLYRKLYEAHRRRCEKKRKEPQLAIQSGRTVSTVPSSVSSVQLAGPIFQHQPTVIDMRAVQPQQQVQQVQHIQHPAIIEQVIHVTQVPTSMGGGRQEIKYDLVPATVDMENVNQIMNLIKVKGQPQQ